MIRLLILFLFSVSLFSQSTGEAGQDEMNKLLEKDKKKREQLLARYYNYVNNLKKRYPELDFKEIPIDPNLAKDVVEHNEKPGEDSKKVPTIPAFVTDNFQLRAEPSYKNKEFITKVTKGEKIEILLIIKEDSKPKGPYWTLIRAKNAKEGYIVSDMLSSETPALKKRGRLKISASVKKSRSITEEMVVTASQLRVRNSAGLDGDVVDFLQFGDSVGILERQSDSVVIDGITGNWTNIVYGNDNKGWVFSGYLSTPEEAKNIIKKKKDENTITDDTKKNTNQDEDPNELKSGEKRYVKSPSLRMRDEPNTSGTVVYSIPSQAQVMIKDAKSDTETISGIQSKWVSVEYDGMEGWVFGGFLSKNQGAYIDHDDISKTFILPLGTLRISSGFGSRVDPVTGKANAFHSGIDMPAPAGTPIKAVADGKVYHMSSNSSYGNLTILEHRDEIYTYYGHQSLQRVHEGDKVKAGDVIGDVGTTGKSTGNHLHFEVRKGGAFSAKILDPMTYLPK